MLVFFFWLDANLRWSFFRACLSVGFFKKGAETIHLFFVSWSYIFTSCVSWSYIFTSCVSWSYIFTSYLISSSIFTSYFCWSCTHILRQLILHLHVLHRLTSADLAPTSYVSWSYIFTSYICWFCTHILRQLILHLHVLHLLILHPHLTSADLTSSRLTSSYICWSCTHILRQLILHLFLSLSLSVSLSLSISLSLSLSFSFSFSFFSRLLAFQGRGSGHERSRKFDSYARNETRSSKAQEELRFWVAARDLSQEMKFDLQKLKNKCDFELSRFACAVSFCSIVWYLDSLSFLSRNVFRKHSVWFSCASTLHLRRVLQNNVWFW